MNIYRNHSLLTFQACKLTNQMKWMALSEFYMIILFFWQWSADISPVFVPVGRFVPGHLAGKYHQILFFIFIEFFDVFCVFHNISLLFKQNWKILSLGASDLSSSTCLTIHFCFFFARSSWMLFVKFHLKVINIIYLCKMVWQSDRWSIQGRKITYT